MTTHAGSEGMPTEREWLEGLTQEDRMTTHADLLAAIDKARTPHYDFCCSRGCAGGFGEGCDGACNCDVSWHDAHLDTLRAILDLCEPLHPEDPERDRLYPDDILPVVADALTRMGALP